MLYNIYIISIIYRYNCSGRVKRLQRNDGAVGEKRTPFLRKPKRKLGLPQVTSGWAEKTSLYIGLQKGDPAERLKITRT